MNKNSDKLLKIDNFEEYYDLPEGWVWTKLTKICDNIPTGVQKYEGIIEYFSTGSIQKDDHEPEGTFSYLNRPSRANRIGKLGDTFQARMKETNKPLIIENNLEDKLFSTGFIQLRPHSTSQVTNLFLFFFVQSPLFLSQRDRLSTGSTQISLTDSAIKLINIPLCSIGEQQRIVIKIQKILPHIAASKKNIDHAQQIVQKFKQAVLAAASDGRLTEEWRENKLATSHIGNEQKIKSQTLGETDPDCLNFKYRNQNELPADWQYAALKDLGKWYSGGTPSKSQDEYWLGGTIPWISPKDMKKEVLYDSQDHITKQGLDSGRLHLLPKGTILFVVRGLILARDFPIALTECESTINQDMKAIVPNTIIDKRYLLHVLQNEKSKILFATKESTHGTKRLESESLLYWPVPLPPLTEQHEIVRRVGLLFERADAFDQEVAASGRRCERLTQAVLGKAFAGKL